MRVREGLRQTNGDGIGLLARGARTGPHVERMALAVAGGMLGQQWKVVRFAKEGREVGGQRVGERLPLRLVAPLQQFEVVGEARQPARPQPARQPAVDHVLLRIRQRDPGARVNQAPDALEVLMREMELPGVGHLLGGRDGNTLGHGWRRAGGGENCPLSVRRLTVCRAANSTLLKGSPGALEAARRRCAGCGRGSPWSSDRTGTGSNRPARPRTGRRARPRSSPPASLRP